MMDNIIKLWRERGEHLPNILRDFHDQKDVFEAIHRFTKIHKSKHRDDISWVDGQIYVIDVFLWSMARFGYTLQKTRKKGVYDSIQEHVDFMQAESHEALASIITNHNREDRMIKYGLEYIYERWGKLLKPNKSKCDIVLEAAKEVVKHEYSRGQFSCYRIQEHLFPKVRFYCGVDSGISGAIQYLIKRGDVKRSYYRGDYELI